MHFKKQIFRRQALCVFYQYYGATVQSILDFSATVWGIKTVSSLSVVQKRGYRFFLIVYRPGYFTVHPPPRLQVDQNFLTQKIVADPKMRCHQKSFGIWRVTEAILGQKMCFFFSKNIFWKKFIINHTIFFNF